MMKYYTHPKTRGELELFNVLRMCRKLVPDDRRFWEIVLSEAPMIVGRDWEEFLEGRRALLKNCTRVALRIHEAVTKPTHQSGGE